MSAKWWINDVLLDVANGEDMAISFRTQATSQVSFSVVKAFDTTPDFSYRQLVTIKRGETLGGATQFFRGRVDRTNRVGNVQHEAHDFHVTDAWQDLEDTIYQESWGLGAGSIYLPKAALGVSSAGVAITIGEQIEEVVSYAASVGVDIAVGTIEPGVILWPMNVENASCAEVIRTSLKFFPDFTPWIDHGTSPPTLNVTKSADLETRNIDLSGAGVAEMIRVSRRDDLQLDAVRLLYNSVDEVDGEPFRHIVEDKWPTSGPSGGPRVLVASLNLAGLSASFRKTPIEVLAMPTDAASAKTYLKEKFPVIAAVNPDHFSVTEWTRTVVTPTAGEEDRHELTTINPNATRLQGSTLEHLPNDLIRGTIDDSMRVRVGRVHVAMAVSAGSGATSEEVAALAKLPSGFTVTATNATTKVYVSCEQYQAGEDAPTGIAQAVHTSMNAAYLWEGEVPLVEVEAGAVRYHGTAINVTGTANSELATMNAPVYAVDIDVASGKTVIGFGPPPHLAPDDMIELQRQIRSRPATWWTTEERTSNQLGNAEAPSAQGDVVAPYDMPMLLPDSAAGSGGGPQPFELVASGTEGDNILKVRESTLAGEVPGGFTAGMMDLTISDAAGVVYAKLTINGTTGAVTARAVEKATNLPANTSTVFHELIGSYTVTGSGGSAVISASNARYGPIPATICRNWFAAEAPFYGVSFG